MHDVLSNLPRIVAADNQRDRQCCLSRIGCVVVDLGSRQHRLPCSGQDLDYAPLKRSVRHIESTMPVGRKPTPRTCAGCAGRPAPSGSAGRARPARWRSARRSRITHRQRRLRAKPMRALRPSIAAPRRFRRHQLPRLDPSQMAWSLSVAASCVGCGSDGGAGGRSLHPARESIDPSSILAEPPLHPPALLASGTRQPSSAVEPQLPHRSR